MLIVYLVTAIRKVANTETKKIPIETSWTRRSLYTMSYAQALLQNSMLLLNRTRDTNTTKQNDLSVSLESSHLCTHRSLYDDKVIC